MKNKINFKSPKNKIIENNQIQTIILLVFKIKPKKRL